MGDYLLIDTSGTIINNIVLDDGAEWLPPEGVTSVDNGAGKYAIGGTLINGVYTAPMVEIVPPPISNIAATATKLGLKRAFEEMGIWQQVKDAIASDPDAQEEWGLAVDIKRDDPLTQKLIAGLHFTSEQVDNIIIRANALV